MQNILIEQNPHWQGKVYESTKRDALEKLISYLPLRQIITITGIRRCGKSTLAKQAISHLISSGVTSQNILFINLENPNFLEHRSDPSYLGVIFDEYLKLASPQGKIYCVFDEIQFFDNWQVYIKSKYESSDTKFIITGSNSSMLSNELNTMLSGRSLNIHLNTFSFVEFLRYKEIDISSKMTQIANKIAITRAKEEYLKWGGFFEVFAVSDERIKKEILISYARNIIYQDIVPRYAIRNSEVVERLFFYLLTTIAGIINYTSLASTFGVSDKTIREYIGYFEDVFLIRRVDRYHQKPKERIKSPKKIYVLDNGFLQISPRQNLGAMLENAVFVALNSLDEVSYLKELYEIDFCSGDTLYQVSYDLSDEKTKNRELRAFGELDSRGKYKHKLISFDHNETINDIEVVSYDRFVIGKR